MQSVTYVQGLPKLTPEPWVLTRKGVEVFRFEDLCTGCDACVSVCPVDCIDKISDPKTPGYAMGDETSPGEGR